MKISKVADWLFWFLLVLLGSIALTTLARADDERCNYVYEYGDDCSWVCSPDEDLGNGFYGGTCFAVVCLPRPVGTIEADTLEGLIEKLNEGDVPEAHKDLRLQRRCWIRLEGVEEVISEELIKHKRWRFKEAR